MRRNDPIVAPAPFQFAVHGMELGAAHAGQVLFEMRIDILGGSSGNSLHRNEQLKERPPPVLSSLPPEAWAVVVKEMKNISASTAPTTALTPSSPACIQAAAAAPCACAGSFTQATTRLPVT